MLYSVSIGYQRFGGLCCLHVQGTANGAGKISLERATLHIAPVRPSQNYPFSGPPLLPVDYWTLPPSSYTPCLYQGKSKGK